MTHDRKSQGFLFLEISKRRANELGRIFARGRVPNIRSIYHVVWLAIRQIGHIFRIFRESANEALTTQFRSFCDVPLCRAAGVSISSASHGIPFLFFLFELLNLLVHHLSIIYSTHLSAIFY